MKRRITRRAPFTFCERTGKRRFETAAKARKRARESRDYFRPYLCPFCDGWHLSTQAPKRNGAEPASHEETT